LQPGGQQTIKKYAEELKEFKKWAIKKERQNIQAEMENYTFVDKDT